MLLVVVDFVDESGVCENSSMLLYIKRFNFFHARERR
jgi:hypothetical protein